MNTDNIITSAVVAFITLVVGSIGKIFWGRMNSQKDDIAKQRDRIDRITNRVSLLEGSVATKNDINQLSKDMASQSKEDREYLHRAMKEELQEITRYIRRDE